MNEGSSTRMQYCDLEQLKKKKRWSVKEIGQALIACEGHKAAGDGLYKESDLDLILDKVQALKTVSARREAMQYKVMYDFLHAGYKDSMTEASCIEALLQAQFIQALMRGYKRISDFNDQDAIKDPISKKLISIVKVRPVEYEEDKDGYAIDMNERDPNTLQYYRLPDFAIENFSIIKAFNASLPLIAERFEVDAELFHVSTADTIESIATQLNKFLQALLNVEEAAVNLSQCEVKPEYIEDARQLLAHSVTPEQALKGDYDIINALTHTEG